ncbi:hypothetical protein [Rhodococcus sp. JT-3]|uniref:hypothetical protein n=1 Tax=Rhodococcus sp. JT-3 TaxID=1973213 RepID=UPI001303A40E|nr:hypothetical protein [Rhodococcus sp. JT-3]
MRELPECDCVIEDYKVPLIETPLVPQAEGRDSNRSITANGHSRLPENDQWGETGGSFQAENICSV